MYILEKDLGYDGVEIVGSFTSIETMLFHIAHENDITGDAYVDESTSVFDCNYSLVVYESVLNQPTKTKYVGCFVKKKGVWEFERLS